MRSKKLLSFFPFQTKRLWRFTWISLILISFCLLGLAADEVRQFDDKDPKQTLKQAEKHIRKGELAEAEKLLRELIREDSTNIKAKLNLSYVLLKQRKLNESYQLSFDIAKADAKNSRAFALVGMALLGAGNFKEAESVFYQSYQLNREESLAWAGAGMLDFYLNRIENSIQKLQEAEFRDPNDSDVVFALAQVYARAEKYKEAAEAYNRFLSVSSKNDTDRRNRIKGLIGFLRFLGNKQELYQVEGSAKQTTLQINLQRDRPILEVGVNGKPEKLRFVLDTGSGISVISNETAEKLKIKAVSRGGHARAVGGDGKFEIVYGFLRTVELGSFRVRNVPVYIRQFHDESEKVDGYIGLSLISKFITTVDYGDKKFTLTKKDKNSIANFEKEEISLPLRLTSSGFLSGEVNLPGIEAPLNFIVDTGASISVISAALAKTDQMSRFSIDEKMRVIGAAGITENVDSYMIPRVSFGTHSREGIKAIALDLDVINEASGFEQAGILGGNFLKNYRLTFDFQNSRVIFVPVRR